MIKLGLFGLKEFAQMDDPLDYWRLCEEVSVAQAALLIVGADPTGSTNIDNG
jgi:hypothetical protein